MAEIDLTGKIAIVTGGGRGLGRSMTLALTNAGASVAVAMHIAEDAEKISADCADLPGKVIPIIADIRNPEECKRVVEETNENLGGVHMLVNNAGVGMLLVSDSFTRIPTKPRNRPPRDPIAPSSIFHFITPNRSRFFFLSR